MLRGSEDKKILDKGHQKLSVYGLGKDETKEFWQSFLRQMLAYGHLKINFQKYGAIEITNTGIQVLKNVQKFMYKEIATKPVKDIIKPKKYLKGPYIPSFCKKILKITGIRPTKIHLAKFILLDSLFKYIYFIV